jgi:histidine ammonia-lyase
MDLTMTTDSSTNTILLSGETLTRAEVVAVARGGAGVEVQADAWQRVAAAAEFLGRELERGHPIYGVTTGFGSNADRLLGNVRLRPRPGCERPLVAELQRNLIISHAVCMGPPLPLEVSRAMLLIRINTLLRGHSGIRPGTVERLVLLLNRGLIPVVPEKGSVGASGDLAPLSHLALPLLGLGEVWVGDVRRDAATVMVEEGLAPLELSYKEGLALNNGTALMLALGVLAVDDCERLLATADLAAAMSLEAFCGRSAAFDERVHALRPHPGQVRTAAQLRHLLADSSLVDIPYHRVPRFQSWTPGAWPEGDPRTFDLRWDYVPQAERAGREGFYQQHLPFRGGKKFQPQDAYSLRCVPQVHGAVRDTLTQVSSVLEIELNAVTDNPLVFPEAESGDVLSAGNFHGMPLALALASLKTALPVLASISERRLCKLVDPATNDGLPPFLIGNEDGTDSGMMIVQYTAAALVNELASRAQPASVYSVPTSANAEDHVSMGANEGLHAYRQSADLGRVLALELLVAAQALEYRLQILQAAAELAADPDPTRLRARLRNLSPVGNDQRELLEADIERLRADLAALQHARPGSAVAKALATIRAAGVEFVDRDRLLGPDLVRMEGLVAGGSLLQDTDLV